MYRHKQPRSHGTVGDSGWKIGAEQRKCLTWLLSSSTKSTTTDSVDIIKVKPRRKPHEQRVDSPRPARRMNHPFKYLYRHDFNTSSTASDPVAFLLSEGGYTMDQVVAMNQTYPVLLELSVQQQLYPKMQFLKRTLGQMDPSSISHVLPPFYFGSRLEKVIAPRHAFLVWVGLPSGPALFDETKMRDRCTSSARTTKDQRMEPLCLFQEFMETCRNSKQFAAMCQSWMTKFGTAIGSSSSVPYNELFSSRPITAKDIDAFDAIFARGLLAAARNDLVQPNNTWPIEQLPTLTAAHVVRLLIQHGANPYAVDHRGVSLLHWACGTGHWDVAKEFLPYHSIATRATRDGATPLHWAAAGTTTREFGVGGHKEVCAMLLQYLPKDNNRTEISSGLSLSEYVNIQTLDGNSALMWAAWSGTLDTVKLLIRSTANPNVANENGCTVAHWAASGGNVHVCRYLHQIAHVDFTVPNYGGNTPMTHAVAFGRADVVQWLLDMQKASDSDGTDGDDDQAYSLAQNFVQWTGGDDVTRNSVLQLFETMDD